jgi:hypothetical protein
MPRPATPFPAIAARPAAPRWALAGRRPAAACHAVTDATGTPGDAPGDAPGDPVPQADGHP